MAKPSRTKPTPRGKSAPRARAAGVMKTRVVKVKANASAGPSRSAGTAKSASVTPTKTRTLVTSAARNNGGQVSASARSRDLQPRVAARTEPPMNRPVPEAVPTDGKPRKNQAGLGLRELEHFRDLLLDKRRELVGDMSQMEREALRSSGGSNLSTLPLHMADMGTDNYEQEFTLGLVEKDRNLLREINAALAKIQNGTYGICEGTGKPISKPRLEAQPWARYSIEHARQLERGMGISR